MKKILIFLLTIGGGLSAQTYNMIRNSVDTATDCNGILYDHGGPSGNYFNSSNDNFYILPAGGGSLDITFTSFNTESCCDRVWIYDNSTGALINNYRGSALPNGGAAINIPSGEARIRFTSDGSVTRSGFALTWSAGGTIAPVANFSASNTNPALRQPVQFTNSSTNGGDNLWLFGDGDSSTATNPNHAYSAPGTYTVSLITTNCLGSDTATTSITVQTATTLGVSPDTINGSVFCGDIFRDTLSIQHLSGSSSFYQITARSGNTEIAAATDFETGMGDWQFQGPSNIASAVIGPAPQGQAFLRLGTYSSIFNGIYLQPSNTNANYYRFWFRANTSSDRFAMSLRDDLIEALRIEVVSGNLRVFGSTTTYQNIVYGTWHKFELKNIDFGTRTADLYLDDVLLASISFYNNSTSEIDRIDLSNPSFSSTIDFDDFLLSNTEGANVVSFVDSIGTTSTTKLIPFSIDLSGKNAGPRSYFFDVRTSAAGADSLITVPINLNVLGTPVYQAAQACIDFDTVFVNLPVQDSLLVFNTGCDTLNFTSISSTNSDFSTNLSSLSLLPGDSAMFFFSFTPSATGSYVDTLFLNGNLDTIICFNANSFNPPQIAFDSSSYNLGSVGCNDSIPFQFYLYNQGTGGNLNWSLLAGSTIFDDFENGFDATIWNTHGSNYLSNGCYQYSGTNAMSTDGSNRFAETVMLSLNQGDSVVFWAFPGVQGSSTGCENPDSGEDLLVQVRQSGSSIWTTIGTVYNYNFTAARYAFAIPQSGQMQVRLAQFSHSGSGFDNYRVDDFEIVTSSSAAGFSPNMGSTAGGDSVLISGHLDVSDLVSGTYTRQLTVQSNDPAHPDTNITVNITVIGDPIIAGSATCVVYDTIYSGQSQTDSVLVFNDGCADLNLSAYALSGSAFGHSLSPQTLSPGDSIWLSISFTPSASNLGLNQDTLWISNNDTLWPVCLEGYAIGAPSAVLNPDSISLTVTNCGDSIGFPVTLSNTGLSALDFKYLSNGRGPGKINVGVVTYTARFTEQTNIINILNSMPEVNYTTMTATSEAAFRLEMDTLDVIIFPEHTSTFIPSVYSPALKDFLNDGGTVIFTYLNVSQSTSYDIMPFTFTSTPVFSIPVSLPGHPIAAGLGTTIQRLSATQQVDYTNTANLERIIGASGNSTAVAATQPYGNGNAIHIGFDFWQTSTDLEQVLKNSVIWGANQGSPSFVSVAPDSGAVAAGDSVTLNFGVNTAGLSNGTYDFNLVFETNDPNNNPLILPLHMVINGTAKAQIVDPSCMSFPLTLQSATSLDTFAVFNEGCDTLNLTSYTANGSDYTITNLPLSVAPGDTAKLAVSFSPLGVGLSTDTLVVSTNDTLVPICVTGTAQGAPIPEISQDTIAFTLQKCKVIGQQQIRVKNIGQGAMNFDIEFGRTARSSKQFYNTAGATTTHSFTNLPNQADTLKLRIILYGDYEWWSERTSLYLDGFYSQIVTDNNLFYIEDTIYIDIFGPNVNTWLADGNLDIQLFNTSSVDGGAGSFHQVDLEVVQVVNWVSVLGANAGTVQPNDSVNRTLIYNAALLPVGTYYTTMNLNNNSPGTPQYNKPVKLDVVSDPELRLSDTCAYFTLTRVGDTTQRSVTIYNDGCAPLTISSMTSTSNQFKINQSSATIPVGDSLVLDIDFIPTSVSTFSASIFLITNDGNHNICLNGQSGAMPIADFSFSDENICIGEVSFNNSASQYYNTLFWDFGDGTSSNQNNPTHIFPNAGTFRVTLRTSNTLGFDTISKLVTVNPLEVNFSMAQDTIQMSDTAFFSDSTVGAVTWIWDFGDGSSSTQQNPSHKYSAQGLYNVKLTVIDGRSCSNTLTKRIVVENRIGLLEWQLSNSWNLFPNPSDGAFVLSKEQGTWDGYHFQVIDAQGRLMAAWAGQQSAELERSLNLAPGVYQIQVMKQGALLDQRRLLIQ